MIMGDDHGDDYDDADDDKFCQHAKLNTHQAGLIIGLRQANERLCYFVTMSLNGYVKA